MNQTEKRLFLIRSLLDEQPRYRGMKIPHMEAEQKRILRSLFNIRMPGEISDEFLSVQDEYLREETKRKGVTALAGLTPADPGIYLWKSYGHCFPSFLCRTMIGGKIASMRSGKR